MVAVRSPLWTSSMRNDPPAASARCTYQKPTPPPASAIRTRIMMSFFMDNTSSQASGPHALRSPTRLLLLVGLAAGQQGLQVQPQPRQQPVQPLLLRRAEAAQHF